eukprot:972195-Prymnesium_polylepis.1
MRPRADATARAQAALASRAAGQGCGGRRPGREWPRARDARGAVARRVFVDGLRGGLQQGLALTCGWSTGLALTCGWSTWPPRSRGRAALGAWHGLMTASCQGRRGRGSGRGGCTRRPHARGGRRPWTAQRGHGH